MIIKANPGAKLVTFLISPFLSLIVFMSDIKSRSTIAVIAGFFLLFGLSFVPINEDADSFRYAEAFQSFSLNPEQNYAHAINVYFGDSGLNQRDYKDIYIYTMYYLASKIGGQNIHILFLLFALVFTFFAIKSFMILVKCTNFQNNWPTYILAFLFLYSNNIFNINGVRFWTASWMAVYFTLEVMVNKKYLYLLGIAVLPLVHASMVLYWAFFSVAFISRFTGIPLLSKIYLISFFFGEIGLQLIDVIYDRLPPVFQMLVWNYTESDWGQSRMDGTHDADLPLYAKVFNELPRLYEFILLYLASLKGKYFKDRSMIGFTLAYFSCVNVSSIIPSMTRYFVVGYPFIIYIWVSNFEELKGYKRFLYLMPVAYCYSIFQWLRNVESVTEWPLYISNFFHIVIRALTNS